MGFAMASVQGFTRSQIRYFQNGEGPSKCLSYIRTKCNLDLSVLHITFLGQGSAYEWCRLTLIVPKNTMAECFRHESGICMEAPCILNCLSAKFSDLCVNCLIKVEGNQSHRFELHMTTCQCTLKRFKNTSSPLFCNKLILLCNRVEKICIGRIEM